MNAESKAFLGVAATMEDYIKTLPVVQFLRVESTDEWIGLDSNGVTDLNSDKDYDVKFVDCFLDSFGNEHYIVGYDPKTRYVWGRTYYRQGNGNRWGIIHIDSFDSINKGNGTCKVVRCKELLDNQ